MQHPWKVNRSRKNWSEKLSNGFLLPGQGVGQIRIAFSGEPFRFFCGIGADPLQRVMRCPVLRSAELK
jgi:hypothetical protein